MKLKIDANGNAVLEEVKGVKMPVYVHDDNTESPFDVASTVASIAARAAQSKRVEDENKAFKEQLRAFSEIKDPTAAIKALQTVEALDHKRLVDAGEVDKVKAEVAKVYDERIQEVTGALNDLQSRFFEQVVGGEFSRSKTIAEKFIIPADMVQARFGNHFGIDNDRIYATDASGNRIFSRTNPGELAGFDEALMTLVEQYPYKDHILKGAVAGGSGAGNGSGGGGGGKRTVTRAAFEAMAPADQAKAAAEASIVDA